ncbi:MAG TPA: class I SAM-dependent rRNA methyltransferase [Anaerolineales bacterium]|nr:class I SAM-dependent rRNA methyltransferase [Anaerolineae bacterium]HIQ02652.1 class I SAM-dependent rRNA methyltransferase [Anaerolineales bacterium]
MSYPYVILKSGRERSVLRRHPWIFSGAVARVEGQPANGEVVEVRDAGGGWLARGYINRHSQITVRILTWDPDEGIDRAFWRRRLEQAVASRATLSRDPGTTAYRLVHAESDGLPGLVADRYGECVVVQFLTLGLERWREEILDGLADLLAPQTIFERSDVEVREKEGLPPRVGRLRGEEPPQRLEILEHGHRFWVEVQTGQKTGFYLDQRENRARLPAFCAEAEMLDGFSYTGAFGVYAACGGAARVTFVETSGPALGVARQNLALNGQRPEEHEFVEGNAFQVLRGFRAEGRTFDLIVLDPPKFAPTARDVRRAARGYKDINLLAFQLLRPGGILFSTSCSGAISADLFQKILFGAALDAGREAQIIGYLHQGSDHPVALTFPEGTYLKGLICRVW